MKRPLNGIVFLALAILVAVSPADAAEQPAAVAGCTPCHGDEGIARDTEVPHLAGQNEVYLANQLRAFRSGDRAHPDMAVMASALDDATIAALAAYYADLASGPWAPMR
jgi:cytochrome c553